MYFRSLLANLWRFSCIFSFPLIIYLYLEVMNMPFSMLDDGYNQHKFIVIGAYVAYLLIWWRVNVYLQRYRRRN